MLTRRQFLHAGALMGGAFFGPACIAPGPDPGPLASSGPGSPQRVNFGARAAISHVKSLFSAAPWTVARARGYFEELGLTHTLTEFSGGRDTIRGLVTGNHYGLTAPA